MPVYSLIVFGGFVNRAIQRFSLTENSATICEVLHPNGTEIRQKKLQALSMRRSGT
jgi:hypothetical protein